MILYGFLEPQWDFSGEAPNDVPRDMPDDGTGRTLINQQFYPLPNSLYPQPTRIYEAPRGPFIGEIGQGFWPTPSQALFIIPTNTQYYGAPISPVRTGQRDPYAQAATYPSPQYFSGQAPTTGIYTGMDEEY